MSDKMAEKLLDEKKALTLATGSSAPEEGGVPVASTTRDGEQALSLASGTVERHPNSINSTSVSGSLVPDSNESSGLCPDSSGRPVEDRKVARKQRLRSADSEQEQKSGDNNDSSSSDEDEDEDAIQIGAISVEGWKNTSRGATGGDDDDDDDDDDDRDVASRLESQASAPPVSLTHHEYAVEATAVQEHSAAFREEEKQIIEMEARERLLNELAGEATHAEIVILDEEDPKQGRKNIFFPAAICFVVALVASITAGILLSRQTPSPNPATALDFSTPFPSDQPSVMPTSAPLNNTFCEEAHQISVGQIVSGNLENSVYTCVVFCGADSPFLDIAPGRWYIYRGGGFPVTAHTDDDSVDIHVYLNCDGFVCMDGFNYGSRRVQWEAELNTDYFILVSGDILGQTATQNFTLTLETNDSLETAFGPIVPASNTMVSGSTIGAKTTSGALAACGSASAPSGSGVWYSVVGNGQTITASTCGSLTSFDTQISVFLMTDNLLCLDGNDNFCSSKSQVAWSSVSGQTYYVLVHGKSGSEGTFTLQLATQEAAFADADFCANAQPLDINSTLIVDLSKATVDPDISNCVDIGFPGGGTNVGNFYKFTGTGQPVRISVSELICSGTFLSVLTGSSCGALECVDPACYTDCVVTTNLDQDYYVYAFYLEEVGLSQCGSPLTVEDA